jgi:hypothetical protein
VSVIVVSYVCWLQLFVSRTVTLGVTGFLPSFARREPGFRGITRCVPKSRILAYYSQTNHVPVLALYHPIS